MEKLNNKIEELINTLDSAKIQCSICKKWYIREFYKFEIKLSSLFICCACNNVARKMNDKISEKIKKKYYKNE